MKTKHYILWMILFVAAGSGNGFSATLDANSQLTEPFTTPGNDPNTYQTTSNYTPNTGIVYKHFLGIRYDYSSHLRQLDFSTNNAFQYNLSFKAGKRFLYAIPTISYDINHDDRIACGFGFGSKIDFANRFYLNAEALGQLTIAQGYDHYRSIRLGMGYHLASNAEITTGPIWVWHGQISKEDYENNYQDFDKDLLRVNDTRIGWNLSLSVNL